MLRSFTVTHNYTAAQGQPAARGSGFKGCVSALYTRDMGEVVTGSLCDDVNLSNHYFNHIMWMYVFMFCWKPNDVQIDWIISGNVNGQNWLFVVTIIWHGTRWRYHWHFFATHVHLKNYTEVTYVGTHIWWRLRLYRGLNPTRFCKPSDISYQCCSYHIQHKNNVMKWWTTLVRSTTLPVNLTVSTILGTEVAHIKGNLGDILVARHYVLWHAWQPLRDAWCKVSLFFYSKT